MLKRVLSGLKKRLAIESPLKILKNVFNFTLKALSVLKIFDFLIMFKNGLIRKIRLNSKFTTSQLG